MSNQWPVYLFLAVAVFSMSTCTAIEDKHKYEFLTQKLECENNG